MGRKTTSAKVRLCRCRSPQAFEKHSCGRCGARLVNKGRGFVFVMRKIHYHSRCLYALLDEIDPVPSSESHR